MFLFWITCVSWSTVVTGLLSLLTLHEKCELYFVSELLKICYKDEDIPWKMQNFSYCEK